ncbi:unnamed protein product, partial [Sphagnum troendelagicum]
ELGEKSLLDANSAFFEKYSDSLRHRAAVAEILVLLSPEAKPMAVKIIEESSNYGAREAECQWELKDCIAVQKLLETSLDDGDAAS